MTTVYFIRHGIASERGTYANDSDRPLTEEGDRKTRRVAKRLQNLDISFDCILTSPYVRATQTAEILHSEKLAPSLEHFDALAPGGSIDLWINWWQKSSKSERQTIALVGHQPDLANWAEILIWGESINRLILKKAGIIGIEVPASLPPIGNSELFWLTPPRFLLR